MKRGNILGRLEQENKVPEKLSPEKIKSLLDLNTSMPVIDEGHKTEVKLSSSKSGIIKSVAAVAVLVLAFLGLTLADRSKPTVYEPNSQPANERRLADTAGLTGLRGGTYRSLYDYLKDSKGGDLYEPFLQVPSNTYAYTADSDKGPSYFSDNAKVFRDYFESLSLYEGEGAVTVLTKAQYESEPKSEELKMSLVKQSGNKAFAAGETDIHAYILGGENTKAIDCDLMGQTYLMKELSKNAAFQAKNHTLEPYIVGMYLYSDKLAVFYDFHLPFEIGGKLLMNEYCGVSVFDVSDVQNITLVYEYEQPGSLTEARLGSGGRVIMLSNYLTGKRITELMDVYTDGEVPAFLPDVYENGKAAPIGEDKLYILNKCDDPMLTVAASFAVGDNFKRTNTLAITMASQAFAVTDSEVLLYNEYYDNANNSDNASTNHIIKLDYSDPDKGVNIANAVYAELWLSFGWIDGSSFSSTDDYYYFSAGNTFVYVLDKQLNVVTNVEMRNSPRYEFWVEDERPIYSEYYIETDRIVLDGSAAYTFDHIEDNYGYVYGSCICTGRADLSDPLNPVFSTDDEDMTAIFINSSGEDYTNYSMKLGQSLYFAATVLHGREGLEPYYSLFSLDPERVSTQTDYIVYASSDDMTPEGYYIPRPHDSFELTAAEKLDSVPKPDNIEGSYEGRYAAMTDTHIISYYNSAAQIVLMPLTEYKKDIRELTEEEYEALTVDDVGRFYYEKEGTGEETVYRYYYIENQEEMASALAFDVSGGKLRELGVIRGCPYLCKDGRDVEYTFYTGSAYYEGGLYLFSNRGISCTDLSDTGKSIYTSLF